jgi:ribosome-associated protein
MQKNETSNEIVNSIIEGIKEKKGENIVAIDLHELENAVTDHFIICHGSSNRQVDAIADHIEKKLRKQYHESVFHKEGEQQANWILLDYSNFVVHIFQKDVRERYKLEELWADGKTTVIND